MAAFFVRRILWAIPTVLLISIVCFLITNLPAGDVIDDLEHRLMQNQGYSAQAAKAEGDAIRARYGLDQPLPIQYGYWLFNFFRGDFGISLVTFKPVSDMIWDRLGYSIIFALLSLGFAWFVGVAVGIYSATHQYSLLDNIATLLSFLGQSIPDFLLALILLMVVVLVFNAPLPLGLSSSEYANAPWSFDKFKDLLAHLWIPVIVAGAPGAAGIMRVMRGNLMDELGRQYVETARAKGLPESSVINKHAVRIAINPLITLLGFQFPLIISSGVITSIVLSLPTIGPLLQDALLTKDIQVSSTILMMLGILLVLGNLVADMLLAWVDPRIRLD
ncbi:MAG: ABC transporter permease [Anaerolineae bacterium]|nr:ABC transporter permease [Anaerolineae bacterium]